jgi:serine protease Do
MNIQFKTKIGFVILGLTLGIALSNQVHSQGKAPVLKLGEPMPQNLFVELAKAINPAVVNISTSTKPRRMGRGGGGGGSPMHDPLLEFFERFYGGGGIGGGNPLQQQPQTALGTGFIIREDGLILTNNHVIDGADIINVELTEHGDKKYEAKVIGRDEKTDIALIKISAKQKLPFAVFGNSKDLQVGEWVAAFGNPYGHGHTVTKGIVSAQGRSIAELNRFPFIQTDASINPGNSGGPLVNSQGLVIGVNSAIDARAQGIGFAIPIDNVKEIIAELEKNGKVRTGYLGVASGELNPQAAAQLGIKKTEGVIIVQVDQGSPADKAGVETYDVVLNFNGKAIGTPADLSNAVASMPIGSKATMKVLRENKEVNLDVAISERPEKKQFQSKSHKIQGEAAAPNDLGFSLKNVDKDAIKEFNLPEDVTGMAIIVDVQINSSAAMSGLQPGDVIFDVNKKHVKNAADALKKLTKGINLLRIMRNNTMFFATLDNNPE